MEKILMIDDDVQLTELVEEFLGFNKYEFISKYTPGEGLEYLEINSYLLKPKNSSTNSVSCTSSSIINIFSIKYFLYLYYLIYYSEI
jgi:hypothetical protein